MPLARSLARSSLKLGWISSLSMEICCSSRRLDCTLAYGCGCRFKRWTTASRAKNKTKRRGCRRRRSASSKQFNSNRILARAAFRSVLPTAAAVVAVAAAPDQHESLFSCNAAAKSALVCSVISRVLMTGQTCAGWLHRHGAHHVNWFWKLNFSQ